jgi:hypothetical protein
MGSPVVLGSASIKLQKGGTPIAFGSKPDRGRHRSYVCCVGAGLEERRPGNR